MVALLSLLNATCGGGDDATTTSSTPLQLYKNCRWEWPLPGVPSSGSPVFRCYYVSQCSSTSEVCALVPPPAPCPYSETTCVACPLGQPLNQC